MVSFGRKVSSEDWRKSNLQSSETFVEPSTTCSTLKSGICCSDWSVRAWCSKWSQSEFGSIFLAHVTRPNTCPKERMNRWWLQIYSNTVEATDVILTIEYVSGWEPPSLTRQQRKNSGLLERSQLPPFSYFLIRQMVSFVFYFWTHRCLLNSSLSAIRHHIFSWSRSALWYSQNGYQSFST